MTQDGGALWVHTAVNMTYLTYLTVLSGFTVARVLKFKIYMCSVYVNEV